MSEYYERSRVVDPTVSENANEESDILCVDKILLCLRAAQRPLAVHEMSIYGYSQNNIATRMSELARSGIVKGYFRKGENFKEWSLAPAVEQNGQMRLFR